MRPWAALAAALALGSCAAPTAPLPLQPVAVGSEIQVDGQPVPMDPTDADRSRIGNFVYAGGLVLTSRQTSRLHGLSDLKVTPDGRMLALGDQSDLLEARIVLDQAGRLVGVTDATIIALKETTGVDLYAGGQREYDSEGVARLANGALLASFEQHDRSCCSRRTAACPAPPRSRM